MLTSDNRLRIFKISKNEDRIQQENLSSWKMRSEHIQTINHAEKNFDFNSIKFTHIAVAYSGRKVVVAAEAKKTGAEAQRKNQSVKNLRNADIEPILLAFTFSHSRQKITLEFMQRCQETTEKSSFLKNSSNSKPQFGS